jgi:hypothetical protein
MNPSDDDIIRKAEPPNPLQAARDEDLIEKPGVRYTVLFQSGHVELLHLYPQDGDTIVLKDVGQPTERYVVTYAKLPDSQVALYTRGIAMFRQDGFLRKVRRTEHDA